MAEIKPEKVINVSLSATTKSVTLRGPKNELYVYVKDKQMIGCTYDVNVLKQVDDDVGLSEPNEPLASDSSKETTEAGTPEPIELVPDTNPPIGNKKETPDEYRERTFKSAAPPGVYGVKPEEEEGKYEATIEGDEVEPEPLEKPLKDPVLEVSDIDKEPTPVEQPSSELISGEASVGSEVSDGSTAGTTLSKKKLENLVAGDEKAQTEAELYSEDDD